MLTDPRSTSRPPRPSSPGAARFAVRGALCAVLCAASAWSGAAEAAITIRSTQSVGRPRRDAGQGVCATAVHLKDAGGGQVVFTGIDQAAGLIGQAKGSGSIDDKVSRIFKVINFRNADVGSGGDFSGQGTDEAYFPFSDDVGAVPRGNNRNFALRARGYLSVTRPGVVTLAAHADDAHRLSIAGTPVTESDERISARVTRQVNFEAAGLYPLELVYFQNGSVAILEISQADGPEAEGNPFSLDTNIFRLLPSSRLYTARAGTSSCTECAGAGPCPPASYCSDGLCQPCESGDHCGMGCMKCPDEKPVCQAGGCVECASDGQCPPGKVCDTEHGACVPAMPCRTNTDCPSGKICDPDAGVCVTPAIPCKMDSDCPADQVCNVVKAQCVPAPTSCKADADCPSTQVCDVQSGQCKWPARGLYVGGSGCSAAPSSAPGGAASGGLLGLLGLSLMLGRGAAARRRRLPAALSRTVLGGVVFFCMTLLSQGRAEAQVSANAQTFRPAIGPRNVVTLEGTNTPGRLRPIFGGVLEFAYRPLRLIDPETRESLADTVGSMTTLHVLAGLGLTDWLHIGAALPIVLYQSFDSRTPPTDSPTPPAAFGVGDLRLVAKIRIIDSTEKGFGLAFVPQVSFPIGKGAEFRGDDAFDIEPRAAADYRFGNGITLLANLGFLLRTSDQVVRDMLVTHQIRYGVGALFPVPLPNIKGISFGAELVGGTSLGRRDAGPVYSPLDAYLVARWQHYSGLQVDLGGGWGFTNAVGSPQFRLFGGVAYVPMANKTGKKPPASDDPDGDGLVGEQDRCPLKAGPVENQGCPDKDTDGDGIIDRLDACPTQPGPVVNRGCPDKDTDGDGIVDRLDACPTQPGPASNQGCPEPDLDKDGIVDRLDKCPYDPGPAPDGCPERKYIAVTQDKIELKQKVYFATAKSNIARQSFPLLDEIADVLRKRGSMEILVEGHTDSRGGLDYNMQLSEARARSVRDYLVKAGVDPGRLTAKGYGPTRPVADNNTAAGREKNRRTEFVILKQ